MKCLKNLSNMVLKVGGNIRGTVFNMLTNSKKVKQFPEFGSTVYYRNIDTHLLNQLQRRFRQNTRAFTIDGNNDGSPVVLIFPSSSVALVEKFSTVSIQLPFIPTSILGKNQESS